MAELFGEALAGEKGAKPPAEAGGTIVSVAVAANVWRTFDYLWPVRLGAARRGRRIRVPFGRGDKMTLGFVTATDVPPGERTLKTVAETLDADGEAGDQESPFDEPLWKLAEWISHYYMTPLGIVLAAMVPAAVGRHGPRSETVVYLTSRRRDWPDRLGGRQKRLLDELYEAAKQGIEPLTLEALLRHSGAGRASLGRLVEHGLVRLDTRPVTLPELPGGAAADPFDLNEDQQSVLAALEAKLDKGFSVTLLHGVTGSGKT
jgi:primosomal protein N' (replication factor Y)